MEDFMKRFTYAFIVVVTSLLFLGVVTAQAQSQLQNFEGYSIGDSVSIGGVSYGPTDIKNVIVTDPLASGNKALKVTTTNYGAAPVLMFVLPAGKTLADYDSVTFKGYYQAGDLVYKTIMAEAYQTKPTGHHFTDADTNYFYVRTQGVSTGWERISLAAKKISTFHDTVYIALGTNNSGATWYADDVTLVPKIVADTTLLANWGFLNPGRIGNWKFTPGSAAGSGSIGGDTAHNQEWAAIRGQFTSPITATTAQAVVVTGNIEFVGSGIDTWSGLRYGLFQQDSAGTLITSNVDSTRWSGLETYSHGYMFSPVSGTNRLTDGVSGGVGTQWIRVNGNYISTSNGSGPVYLGGNTSQKPVRAVADAGVYAFAFSVQPLANGTKEVRFYLIKGTAAQSTAATYFFGGSFIDTTSMAATFNGVVFAAHTAGSGGLPLLRSVKLTNVKATVGSPITVPDAPWSAYYVDKWGFLNPSRIGNWHFIPDPDKVIGNAGIGGDTSATQEWSPIRGEFFEPVTATNAKALIVTGNIEFVGSGIDTWSGLRYGLFQQDSAGTVLVDSAVATLPDSTRWANPGLETYSHGYMFSPVSGTNRLTDGVSGGVGTQWIRVNGNYISTSNGSGPVYLGGNTSQKPIRAVASAGVYAFAFSVQPLANGTKEVRFYLIKGTAAQSTAATYFFGGSFIDTTSMAATFNGVVFAAHTAGSGGLPLLRSVKLTNVKATVGSPITVPDAPWSAYYVDKWGFLNPSRIGNWHFIPDPDKVIGNAGIGGDTSATQEWSPIRGEFFEPVTATNAKALIVTGNIEFVGSGIDTWSGLRYGLFQQDSAGTVLVDSAVATLPDSTRWANPGLETYSHGYMFSPVSGTNRLTDGVSGGVGTQWIRVNGNYISTSNGSGPVYLGGLSVQKPARAVASAGVYEFAFSVQPLANGTKEVRFYLIKGTAAQSTAATYYFGGSFIDTTSMAAKFNGVVFAAHTAGSGGLPLLRAMKLTNVKVDIGTPFTLPIPPWSAYYVDKWGFYGGRMGRWHFTPETLIGDATIGGSRANTDWAAIRGELIEAFTPTTTRPFKITGQVQFVGGGFEAANSFRFGVFQSDNAGTLIIDSAAATLPDSTRWTGTEASNSGYLIVPPSGANGPVSWNGLSPKMGTYGAVVSDVWMSTGGENSYALGSNLQTPSNAVGGAGTYDFAISVTPAAGMNQVRYSLSNGTSYVFSSGTTDNGSAITKFNSIIFALNKSTSTTALKLTNVKVDTGTVNGIVLTAVESSGGAIPKVYALNQNYPNPFNPSTTIRYDLPFASRVTLTVYDILGRVVTQLVNETQRASSYSVQWNASNLSSGVYFYRINARSEDGSKTFTSVKKLLLMK
jgi:hypothetical protein